VEQGDELLVVVEADGGAALGRLQELRGAPVRGEAAGLGGEEDDVDGAAVASTSSWFWWSSPVSFALATTSVGERPSFERSLGSPAATRRS
jgi:hypothetical protein